MHMWGWTLFLAIGLPIYIVTMFAFYLNIKF